MSSKREQLLEIINSGSAIPVCDLSRLVDDIWKHDVIDTKDRFHNLFFYELCPILKIVNQEHLIDQITAIKIIGMKSRIDGILIMNGIEQGIEITAAIDGQNDALMMELLEERGHAPAYQKIESTGTRNNRVFGNNELISINANDYNFNTLLPMMRKKLENKQKISFSNKNYSNAWLGIVFDDNIMPIIDRKKSRFDPVCNALLEGGAESYAPFSRVFCVGSSRQYIFDSSDLIVT